MEEKKFIIDFTELAFLAESCIPPVPIARAMFWQSLVDSYYFEMSDAQRKKFFEWITKSTRFNTANEDCRVFYARYNPQNQYIVSTEYNGVKESHEAFRFNDRYHVKINRSIDERYILKVEPKIFDDNEH